MLPEVLVVVLLLAERTKVPAVEDVLIRPGSMLTVPDDNDSGVEYVIVPVLVWLRRSVAEE